MSAVAAVVGASGNVGTLVTRRFLEEGYRVIGIVRSDAGAARLREAAPEAEVAVADVASPASTDALRAALKTASVVAACTGTTAFPTQAWAGGDVGTDEVARTVWETWLEENLDVAATVERLSQLGMNTPQVVDSEGAARLAGCLGAATKHVVLVSSLGVTRRDGFPFRILNACGVLDAKAEGEAAIVRAAESLGAAYTIVRPGQLFGPPYDNNSYLGTIFRLDKDARTRGVVVAKGDDQAGDTLRSTLADVVVRAVANPVARNVDFTVLNVQGEPPSTEALDRILQTALST